MKKRILAALLCLSVPGFLLLNAWQGWRYNTLADQVADLEAKQESLLTANRDAIGAIAFETSPAQVEARAAHLGLVPLAPGAETHLSVGGSR